MKLNQIIVVPALLGALLLSACGKKETAPAPAAPAATPATTPAPAPVVNQAGGYEPSAEERVLGITRTKEEQDKINAEALAGTPLPQIPGEAPAVIAPAADADAAPAASK